MKKIFSILAVLLFIGSSAMAQHRHHRMHHRMHHHPMRHHHHMHHHR